MGKQVVIGAAAGMGAAVFRELALSSETPPIRLDKKLGDVFPMREEQHPNYPQLAGCDEVYITIGRPSARQFDKTSHSYELELMMDNYAAVSSALSLTRFWSYGKEASYVIVSSVSGMLADEGGATYGAMKAALSQLVRSLAREWAPSRVNAVAPGPTATEQFVKAFRDNPVSLEAEKARSPHQRLLTPGEVAKAMIGLANMKGVSGVTLPVDLAGVSSSRR